MKLRKLKQLLGGTDYIICRGAVYPKEYLRNYDEKQDTIQIGTDYVRDFIQWNTVTKKFSLNYFGKDTFDKGSELERLWKRMHELAESGELDDIATGKDELKDPIPVFSYRNVNVVETRTERNEFGYPFHDDEGFLMYSNTSFHTKKECMIYAADSILCYLKNGDEYLEEELNKLHEKTKAMEKRINALEEILKKLHGDAK